MSEKLDTMAALEVMGWKPGPMGVSAGLWTGPGTVGKEWNCGHSRWSPTTNLGTAMTVAERVIATRGGIRFSLIGGDSGFGWNAEFFRVSDGHRIGQASEESREMAISIAALRAVGVPEADIEKARKQA